MKVIWKRPDGFLGALPSDYYTVELEHGAKLWLHNHDKKSYPFRVSGGWEDEQSTHKLNNLVNLIDQPHEKWLEQVKKFYADTFSDEPQVFIAELKAWVDDLRNHVKGDSWEVEIIGQALQSVCNHLQQLESSFV